MNAPTITPRRGPEGGPQAALLAAPRRPCFLKRFPSLCGFSISAALPTPPPQRVCERGRQSFGFLTKQSKTRKEKKWGRRGAGVRLGNGDRGKEKISEVSP